MPTPTASDVHVNIPLSNMSIAYLQDLKGFVGTRFFPNIPSMQQSNRYYVYPKGDWFRAEAKVRPPSTESAGSGWRLENTATYFCDVLAIHKDVDDQIRANQDPIIDMDRDAMLWVTQQLALKRDIDFMANFFSTSLWTGSTTGGDITPGTLWSASGSVPIKDIRTQMTAMLKKTGYKPNKLLLGAETWTALQDNADFIDRVEGGSTNGNPAEVNLELLARILGLQEVMVAEAVQNTAKEGAADAMSFVAGKHALLAYVNPNPSPMTASAGYTFSWSGLFGAGAEGQRISRIRMDHLRSDRIEGEMAYDQKIVAADLGCFFASAVA
jgi:hypothetical protein